MNSLTIGIFFLKIDIVIYYRHSIISKCTELMGITKIKEKDGEIIIIGH